MFNGGCPKYGSPIGTIFAQVFYTMIVNRVIKEGDVIDEILENERSWKRLHHY